MKIDTSVEELEQIVDGWMECYNRECPHTGRYCDEHTPIQTLHDTRHFVYQEMLDRQAHQKESDTNDDVITSVLFVG